MKHEHLTCHQWRGEPRDQESTPTDNDAWESLLRTNANLGREVAELKKELKGLSQDYANADAEIVNLRSQLQGVITACHLRGYNVGDSLGEWIEKQFEEAPAYSQSYDLIIPLVRKLTSADLNLRSKFLARIREEVSYKCPKNSVGNPVVSDWDAFVQATPTEWANAIIKAREVKPLLEILRECALHDTGEQDCIASDAAKALSTFTSKHKI